MWVNATTGKYNYPSDDGFVTVGGQIIDAKITLPSGLLIDRFGGEGGNYFSRKGDQYAARALPPSNLNTPTAGPPNGYHVYKVIGAGVPGVLAGPAVPWFGQPGGSIQFYTSQNVSTLIKNGLLEPVKL